MVFWKGRKCQPTKWIHKHILGPHIISIWGKFILITEQSPPGRIPIAMDTIIVCAYFESNETHCIHWTLSTETDTHTHIDQSGTQTQIWITAFWVNHMRRKYGNNVYMIKISVYIRIYFKQWRVPIHIGPEISKQ